MKKKIVSLKMKKMLHIIYSVENESCLIRIVLLISEGINTCPNDLKRGKEKERKKIISSKIWSLKPAFKVRGE